MTEAPRAVVHHDAAVLPGRSSLRVGTSGWAYREWRGTFYPPALRVADQLSFLASRVNSVEINASFYSLLTPSTYRRWYAATPTGFRFALKGSGFITHRKQLRDVERALANFYASGVLRLREKLGPTVWQLPARAGCDLERLERFLELLPRDTALASRLARRHDARLAGRSSTRAGARRRLRHALELRHERFFVPEVIAMARRQRVALVISDAASWPRLEAVTAPFVYVRLHGGERTYASPYDDRSLRQWAARIRRWRRPAPGRSALRDVYVYFDNTAHAHAPADAERLARLLLERPGIVSPAGAGDHRPAISPADRRRRKALSIGGRRRAAGRAPARSRPA